MPMPSTQVIIHGNTGPISASVAIPPENTNTMQYWESLRRRFYDQSGMAFWGNAVESTPRLNAEDIASLRIGILPPKRPLPKVEFWEIRSISSRDFTAIFSHLGFLGSRATEYTPDVEAGFLSLHEAARVHYLFISATQLVAYLEPHVSSRPKVKASLGAIRQAMVDLGGYDFPVSFAENGANHDFFSIKRRRKGA